MPKPTRGPHHHTNPLIWCAAIICAILAVVVIITGIVVFIGYLTIKPKIPLISVASAQLDTIYYDETSSLTVQVTVVVRAKNDNSHARVGFYNMTLALSFHGRKIAFLRADEFDVPANHSVEFNYVVQSAPIPLNPEEGEIVGSALRQGAMDFELKGTTRTRWKVGIIGSVKFWLHLHCPLRLPTDATTVYPRCSSRST